MSAIAIVTCAAFGGSNEACFRAGLNLTLDGKPQPTILMPFFQSGGSYDVTHIRSLIRSAADNIPRPDLIVADGLVTARAAALELQKQDPKFIFLSGDALGDAPAALAGGVNMNAPGESDAQKTLLKSKYPSVRDESIYLVVNGNSPMSYSVAKGWPAERVVKFFAGVPNPPENQQDTSEDNHFIAELDKLAKRDPAPTALVISTDPYFRLFRSALTIAVAEKLPVPVCYPFKDFLVASSKTDNAGNSFSLDKPPLNNADDYGDPSTAYFQLGKQVGRFVAGTVNVGIVGWNGSAWIIEPLPRSGEDAPIVAEASGIEIEIETLKIRIKGAHEKALEEVLAVLRGMR
jgi:hypothetical protein